MVLEQYAGNKKKKTKSFALDDYLVQQLESLSKSGRFGSQSSIVSIALYDFLGKHVESKSMDALNFKEVISNYLKSPDGKSLIRSIIQESLSGDPDKPLQEGMIEAVSNGH